MPASNEPSQDPYTSTSLQPGDPYTSTSLQPGDLIEIDAQGWGLTWAVRPDGQLCQIGLGLQGHQSTIEYPLGLYPLAYRTWGAGDPYHEAALRVTHSDGTLTTRLQARQIRHSTTTDGIHSVIVCHDETFDMTVEHHFLTHRESAVLEQWIEIIHDEPAAIRLHDYDSFCHFLITTADAEICQFAGNGWADEWHWTTEPITPGIRSLTSLGGVQPHLQMSPTLILSPDGASTETTGTVIGVSIAWIGNTRFHLTSRPKGEPDRNSAVTLKAGANPYGADYTLEPGHRFTTPRVAWTWAQGRQEMTDRFHRWTRSHILRDPERLRPIVANNWEATFFDFDQSRITDLIEQSADLGADVFLLDDGWFGSSYPRDDDTMGLGDWEVNHTKLPNGITGLTDAARDAGIRFGIWVEPEMVNPQSRLYEDHPDWVLRDTREPAEHRQQLYLDPLVEGVADFEVDVISRTLGSAPDISYMKWDANRPIIDAGSSALPRDRQSNLFVDSAYATWEIMRSVAEAHPEVELMLCASGGGRNDHGTMRFFHEFWTSDNTDPVERIRMQWAAGHFFPPSVIAAHVTRWGERPLGFACAVALSARFGIDMDLSSLTPTESATLRAAVDLAHRTQNIVQQGRLKRLVSPIASTHGGNDGSRAALAYTDVGSDVPESVVFRYQIADVADSGTRSVGNRSATERSLSGEHPGPVDPGAGGLDSGGLNAGDLDWISPESLYRCTQTHFADSASTQPHVDMNGSELAALLGDWSLSAALTADVFEIHQV